MQSADQSRPSPIRSLTFQVTFIVAILVLLAGGVIGSTLWVLDAQKSDGVVINLAGRQRMLTQKLSKEFLLAQQGDEQSWHGTESLFDVTLTALKNGGETFTDLGSLALFVEEKINE